MTELLEPKPGDRILEIGTGSGYQAAILATLGCTVLSIERHADLAAAAASGWQRLGFGDRVEVRGRRRQPRRARRGAVRWDHRHGRRHRPIPDPLREQLADGGRLVIPVGPRGTQELIVVERQGAEWRE